MNKIMLLISTTSAVLLTALAENCIQLNNNEILAGASNSIINVRDSSDYTTQQYMSSLQHQQTAITINGANLKAPHFLSITTAGSTQLVGEIAVNGVVVKNINNNQASVNLSPLLSTGINSVEISGNYKPARDSVRIQFSGPGTKVTQQTSGNGILRETLIIAVH